LWHYGVSAHRPRQRFDRGPVRRHRRADRRRWTRRHHHRRHRHGQYDSNLRLHDDHGHRCSGWDVRHHVHIHSAADAHSIVDAYAHAIADGYFFADAIRDAHEDEHPRAIADAVADAVAVADPVADPNAIADANAVPDAHEYARPFTDTSAD